MKKNLLFTISYLFSLTFFAQNVMPQLDESKKNGSTTPSQTMTIQCKGFANPPSADLKWRPILTTKYTAFEPMAPNQELIEKIKSEKLKIRQEQIHNLRNENSGEPSTQTITPIVGTNYLGNTNGGYSPLDNSMAISNGGYIVSVANGTIEYDDISGNNLYYNNLLTLVNGVDANITGVCDPVVIYDSGSDRFICFCQSTPISAANKIFVFFSKSNNPSNGWWIYEFNGDLTGGGDGFDYPKIAVSTNELFVTGNLFYTSGGSHNAVIYQMDKLAGYTGSSANYLYYTNITGSPFTLLPVSYGQSGNYGPGIFLVSTIASGGSTINLYQVTNDICCTPLLNYWSVPTTAYSVTQDANQLGSTCLLNTGDCRALSGFYLSNAGVGTIHFVFHSDYNNTAYHGINYNRLIVNTLTNTSSMFGLTAYDYCYPSVVSYAASPADNSVMIGFGRSGSTIHPEERVVNCDNAMNWSGSTLVKSSSSYVSYTSTTNERWGDYTGTTRKHNSTTPSIWMNGMFGNTSNTWDTWIAEIHGNSTTGINEQSDSKNISVYPNPIIDAFNIEFDLTSSLNIEIVIYDIQGKIVKELFKGKANVGTNNFSFNKANLSAGTYFLTIKSTTNIIKNEKIIIAH